MIDPEFFSRLDAMSIQFKRHTLGKYQGEQKTVYAGDGLTFKDFAPYTVGDDFRRIDWRIFARTKELFIRRYEEDRNLTIHILLDASGSMAYGGKGSKFSYAAMMGLGLAYIAQKRHDRIELSTFSDKILPLKSQNENINVQTLVKKLNKMHAKGMTNFEDAMKQYHKRVKTKSLLFIFSDVLYPLETLSKLLERYQRSQLFLVQVLHKDEVELPFKGEMKFVDPENEDNQIKTYVSKRMRSIYNDSLHEHVESIKDACKGRKARFIQLDTRDGALASFIKLWNVTQ
jgi:uncharacterized protein (DUF58 family)